MSTHFKSVCKHGMIVTQCRCPSKDKEERLVPCPSLCDPIAFNPNDKPYDWANE
jgi:hypothetical protein